METPSKSEIEALAQLIQEASAVGNSATAFSAQRLKVCVEVGEKLREWKKAIPRGQWGKFVGDHFPTLPERTSQRWMRLAETKATGRLKLDTARGLRHAYQLAGLLPDAESSKTQGEKVESHVVHIARLVAALQHIQLDLLTPSERNELKIRLKPVALFIEKL